MAKKKENDLTKTNAMRLLEQAGISFRIETYEFDEKSTVFVNCAFLFVD